MFYKIKKEKDRQWQNEIIRDWAFCGVFFFAYYNTYISLDREAVDELQFFLNRYIYIVA